MIASPARLLVVEDDYSMTVMLRTLLEKEGYAVTTACDGQEALDTLAASPLPDLIVSDILMPRLDGFELLRRVRAVEAWSYLPFLFLSAMSEPEDRITGRSLGVDDYITKPFHSREFLSVVASRLERARSVEARQSVQIAEIKRQILMLLNHEFRTPLTVILEYTRLLEEFPQRRMAREEILEFLYNISSGAQRLRRLIENFVLLVELRYSAEAEAMYIWRMRRHRRPESHAARVARSPSPPDGQPVFNIEADERIRSSRRPRNADHRAARTDRQRGQGRATGDDHHRRRVSYQRRDGLPRRGLRAGDRPDGNQQIGRGILSDRARQDRDAGRGDGARDRRRDC